MDDHYHILGLDMSASTEDVQAASLALESEADALAYSSPERAREVWRSIRLVRDDLLSGSERRYRYDRALLAITAEEPALPEATSYARVRSSSIRSFSAAWLVCIPVFVAVLVLIFGLRSHGSSVTPRPPTLIGGGTAHPYASGHTVRLAWLRVPQATLYRLQLATTPIDPSDAVVFAHASSPVTTQQTAYLLRVLGPQLYYWRVQALQQGVWSRFPHSRHFVVGRPAIAIPARLLPGSGTITRQHRIRLCWASVPGARAYLLRIRGMAIRTVQHTCATVVLASGTYRWSVATRAMAARLLTGRYTADATLTILPPPTATPRPTATPQPTSTSTPVPTPKPHETSTIRFSPPISCHGAAQRRDVPCKGDVTGTIGNVPYVMAIERGSLRALANGGGLAVLQGRGVLGRVPSRFTITATDRDPGVDTVRVRVLARRRSHLYHWTCTPDGGHACIEISVKR